MSEGAPHVGRMADRRRTAILAWWLALGAGALSAAAPAAGARAAGEKADDSQIVVSGSGEVSLPASRARFAIGITTAAATASAASAENARLAAQVTAALDNAHLDKADLVSSSLTVAPRWEPAEDHRPKRTGFEAAKTLRIDTRKLTELGAYIDAALSAGATDVSDIEFSAQGTESARRRALAQAVAAARADAEAIAQAAGGTLGEPLLISTERSTPAGLQPLMVSAGRARASPATELIPGEIRIAAQVEAHWRLILPSPASR